MVNGFKNTKRSYKDLQADPFVKTPWLTWVLDRKLFYVAAFSVGAVFIGQFALQGVAAYDKITAPPENNSPYLSIDPKMSHAMTWASELIKEANGLEGWTIVDSIQPSHGFLLEKLGINTGEVPLTMLSTSAASAGSTKVFIQTYGAGQARKQYDNYVSALDSAGGTTRVDGNLGIQSVLFTNGFLIVAGDSIMGLITNDDGARDSLYSDWMNLIEITLPESSCVSVDASTDESSRSIFYGEDKYTGLLESQQLETDVNISYIPTVTGALFQEIGNIYAKQPESPLPEGMASLPVEVNRPTLPANPADEGGFIIDVSYMIADPIGPGCGWEWASQRSLEYNLEDLEATQKQILIDSRDSLNERAQIYANGKIQWARLTALILPKLDDWNLYVNGVNGVHAAWAQLEQGRVDFKPLWDAYLSAHENWRTFDERQTAARTDYDTKIKECKVKTDALADWIKNYKKPLEMQEKLIKERASEQKAFDDFWTARLEGLTGDELEEAETERDVAQKVINDRIKAEDKDKKEIPAKPEGCDGAKIEKPSILDEQKPEKPTAPAPPAGITIPESWAKPE